MTLKSESIDLVSKQLNEQYKGKDGQIFSIQLISWRNSIIIQAKVETGRMIALKSQFYYAGKENRYILSNHEEVAWNLVCMGLSTR